MCIDYALLRLLHRLYTTAVASHHHYHNTNSAVDPEAARELDEKEALARAQERMSLRHKNTSKWAKHAQRTQGATAQVCGLGWGDACALAAARHITLELSHTQHDSIDPSWGKKG